MRATTSEEPPGPNGTTSFTGFAGNVCAWTAPANARPAASARGRRRRKRVRNPAENSIMFAPRVALFISALSGRGRLYAGASPRLHRPDEIGEPLARLVRVAALERLEPRDPVHPEIAEVLAPLAPGADRPGAAPVVERERPDVALARLSARVAVVQAQHAAR